MGKNNSVVTYLVYCDFFAHKQRIEMKKLKPVEGRKKKAYLDLEKFIFSQKKLLTFPQRAHEERKLSINSLVN